MLPVLASSRVNPLPQGSHNIQHCGIPVGAGLPAKGPVQATQAPGPDHNLKCPTIPFRSVPNCASSILDRALSCIANAA
ncbi:hypothetical protein CXG50_26340 [Pseudomonas plecoglossicida]|nr:hypothetical protein CSW00_12100 [Pseudomonas sp. MR 02]PLU96318.1 hypothetical protein CXG52_19475 [Pseudomonas plecoglossicida]PLV02862.1 hypothetical protein CXG50_26340 [Pseudomonas plecoglossicida]TXI00822.1 MAG: hypothetical protein E6Q70_21810 [Pseudomonas monteilii]